MAAEDKEWTFNAQISGTQSNTVFCAKLAPPVQKAVLAWVSALICLL